MSRSARLWSGVVGLALVVSLSVLVGVAAAQDGTLPTPVPGSQTRAVTQDEVNAVAKQMYCPVCENEPLDVCRTAACQQWRAQIAQMLSEGQTDAQIKQYFVDRYGLRVLGAPPATGITLWLWVLPIIAVVLGAIYVAVLMKRMRTRATVSAQPTQAKTGGDEYADRVEQDLKDY